MRFKKALARTNPDVVKVTFHSAFTRETIANPGKKWRVPLLSKGDQDGGHWKSETDRCEKKPILSVTGPGDVTSIINGAIPQNIGHQVMKLQESVRHSVNVYRGDTLSPSQDKYCAWPYVPRVMSPSLSICLKVPAKSEIRKDQLIDCKCDPYRGEREQFTANMDES